MDFKLIGNIHLAATARIVEIDDGPSGTRRTELLSSRASRSLLDPFLARPLSCLLLFSGCIPDGPVAQVARARP